MGLNQVEKCCELTCRAIPLRHSFQRDSASIDPGTDKDGKRLFTDLSTNVNKICMGKCCHFTRVNAYFQGFLREKALKIQRVDLQGVFVYREEPCEEQGLAHGQAIRGRSL
jgi:hypothetical protein